MKDTSKAEHHAASIKNAVKAVNEAITEAADEGLEVRLQIQETDHGKTGKKPTLSSRVMMEIG